MNVMAIFAVVEQRDAIITLTQINPLMRASFETRPIPACIAMRRALHIAPLNFVGCPGSKHIYREGYLEQGVAFVPLDRSVKIQAR